MTLQSKIKLPLYKMYEMMMKWIIFYENFKKNPNEMFMNCKKTKGTNIKWNINYYGN